MHSIHSPKDFEKMISPAKIFSISFELISYQSGRNLYREDREGFAKNAMTSFSSRTSRLLRGLRG